MGLIKADIIAVLQRDILLLQGFTPAGAGGNHAGLESIAHAFPHHIFPTGAVHEFIYRTPADAAASVGFVSAVSATLMQQGAAAVWIDGGRMVFPPALPFFNLPPERMLFIHLRDDKQKKWALEEALHCDSLAVVIADIRELSFTESRRLQLAVEQSGVTVFVLRHHPRNLATAAVARWQVQCAQTALQPLPGVGAPRWQVALLKIRNGKPGKWLMEWRNQQLQLVTPPAGIAEQPLRKVV